MCGPAAVVSNPIFGVFAGGKAPNALLLDFVLFRHFLSVNSYALRC